MSSLSSSISFWFRSCVRAYVQLRGYFYTYRWTYTHRAVCVPLSFTHGSLVDSVTFLAQVLAFVSPQKCLQLCMVAEPV